MIDETRWHEIRQHADEVRRWLRPVDSAPSIVDVRNPEPEPVIPMSTIRLGMDVLTLLAEMDGMRAVLQELVDADARGVYVNEYDDGYWQPCPYCGATENESGHREGCLINKALRYVKVSSDDGHQ